MSGNDLKTKAGHGLAKGLGIQIPYRDPLGADQDPVTRGESTFSVGTMDTYSYLESEPTSAEWIKEHTPSWQQVGRYFYSLFPFLTWITRYNWKWFLGDMVAGEFSFKYTMTESGLIPAGITVGCVVIPQGMAYARLAELPVQFGLYSSFMGVLIYWFFATSKDITIGVSNLLFQLWQLSNQASLLLSCPLSSVALSSKPRNKFPTLNRMSSLQPWPSSVVESSASWDWPN